jgi:hypothetical protein
MLEYKTLCELFASLGVPNNPTMHWSNFVGWIFLKIVHIQVENAIVKGIQYVWSIALSFVEFTIIDNGSWICVHVYVINCYTRVPNLVCIARIVNGLSFNNLIQVIMSCIIENGGLTKEELFKKMEWMWWMYFKAKNKSPKTNQGFPGAIFYVCSLCYP